MSENKRICLICELNQRPALHSLLPISVLPTSNQYYLKQLGQKPSNKIQRHLPYHQLQPNPLVQCDLFSKRGIWFLQDYFQPENTSTQKKTKKTSQNIIQDKATKPGVP